jgi:hypothetical protein
MLKGITMVIPFFLLFPTDDYHAERLISTQRFSVGHLLVTTFAKALSRKRCLQLLIFLCHLLFMQ